MKTPAILQVALNALLSLARQTSTPGKFQDKFFAGVFREAVSGKRAKETGLGA
jgi:hypothetical protein